MIVRPVLYQPVPDAERGKGPQPRRLAKLGKGQNKDWAAHTKKHKWAFA